MTRAPVPQRLNRGAVKRSFPRVSEATWDNLFDREKTNGLYEIRVQGPDKYPHYDVEALMLWLMDKNLYRRSDFYSHGELLYEGRSAPLVTRTHLLAG